MFGDDVGFASSAGWNESSAFIRNGCFGVEFVEPSPPSELVMSAATIRPPCRQGAVKSSSATSAMLSSATPEAWIFPFSGRAALWMKSVPGWATPSLPPGRPPPAISTGFVGVAVRARSRTGSRQLPLVAYPRRPPRPLTHAIPLASTSTSCE